MQRYCILTFQMLILLILYSLLLASCHSCHLSAAGEDSCSNYKNYFQSLNDAMNNNFGHCSGSTANGTLIDWSVSFIYYPDNFRPVHCPCCGDPEAMCAGLDVRPKVLHECLQCKYNRWHLYCSCSILNTDWQLLLQDLKSGEKQCFCQGLETMYSMSMSLGNLICPSNALNTARQGKKVSYQMNNEKEELTLEFQGELRK